MIFMKLPFPMWTLTSNVVVYQTIRNDEGENVKHKLFKGPCRYDKKSRTTMNAQREIIELSGLIVCPDDILTSADKRHPLLVEVNGEEKRVYDTNQPDNPDGSIFSTELRLI